MSRFYKTSKPTFVDDVMFKLPFQEIAGVLGKKDGDIDDIYEDIKEFKTSLQTENLSEDDEVVNSAIKGYKDRITQAQDTLQKDYANYNKIVPGIKGISADLEADVFGKFKAAKDNKLAFDKEKEKVSARKGLSGDIKQGYLDELRQNYQAAGALNYDDEKGTFNRIGDLTKELVDDFDEDKYISTVAAGYKSDRKAGSGYRNSEKDSEYWELTGYDKEYIDPSDVRNYLSSSINNTEWDASKRQELYYRSGLRGDELESALAAEKERFIEMGVNKIAFSKTKYDKSVKAKAGAGRAKKVDSNSATFIATPVNNRPSVMTIKDANGAVSTASSPKYGNQSSSIGKYKARYDKGFEAVKIVFGDENMEKFTTAEGTKQMLTNAGEYKGMLNSDAMNSTNVVAMNTAFKSHPVMSGIKYYSDGSQSNLDTDIVSEALQNVSTQFDFGETVITGNGRGTIAAYDKKGSFLDAVEMAGIDLVEAGIVKEQVTQQSVAGTDALGNPTTEMKDVTTNNQVDLPLGNVINALVKNGQASIVTKEYPQVSIDANGTRFLDKKKMVTVRMNMDSNKSIGKVDGQTVEFSFDADKIRVATPQQ